MNKYVIAGISFGTGAGAGALIAHYITKKNEEKRTEERIQSLKEAYERQPLIIKREEPEEEPKIENDISAKVDQSSFVQNKPDIDYLLKNMEEPQEEPQIYIINASEYNDEKSPFAEYKKLTLQYYSNDIFVDASSMEVITDANNLIGEDVSEKFDDEDTLYIRNNYLKIDCDIQRIHHPFITGDSPEDE